MSRCDAKKLELEDEKMKNVKKLKIMALVVIFVTTSLAFTCQAGTSGLASQSLQLKIKAPTQVWEHYTFRLTVYAGDRPLAGAVVIVSWIAVGYVTDSTGSVSITSPFVDHDTQFTILAFKNGYISAKTIITVINLPLP